MSRCGSCSPPNTDTAARGTQAVHIRSRDSRMFTCQEKKGLTYLDELTIDGRRLCCEWQRHLLCLRALERRLAPSAVCVCARVRVACKCTCVYGVCALVRIARARIALVSSDPKMRHGWAQEIGAEEQSRHATKRHGRDGNGRRSGAMPGKSISLTVWSTVWRRLPSNPSRMYSCR